MPPNDPRFLEATLEDIVVDVWAHRFVDDPKLAEEMVNPDFDADLADMEAAMGLPPDPGDFEDTVADDRFGGVKS